MELLKDGDEPVPQICAKCGESINERFLYQALNGYWHDSCLRCSTCEQSLSLLGNSFFVKFGQLFCRNDYLRLFGPRATCSACNTQIYGNDIIMRKDHETIYHVSCFRCCNCKRNFSVGERCVTDRTNGKIFCLDNSCRVYKEKKPRKTKKNVNDTLH